MRRGIHWYLQRTDDMNRLLIWFLAFAVFCACSRDLGNYTYTDLDEPDISGIEDCRVMTLSYLRISPSFDDDFDESLYTFEWTAIDRNGNMEQTVIGEHRDLEYHVVLAPGQ